MKECPVIFQAVYPLLTCWSLMAVWRGFYLLLLRKVMVTPVPRHGRINSMTSFYCEVVRGRQREQWPRNLLPLSPGTLVWVFPLVIYIVWRTEEQSKRMLTLNVVSYILAHLRFSGTFIMRLSHKVGFSEQAVSLMSCVTLQKTVHWALVWSSLKLG